MANSNLIFPRPDLTPANADYTRTHSSVLPYDLLRDASRRLGIMALLAAALWIVATLLDHILAERTGSQSELGVGTDAIAAVSALLSIALFFYTRNKDRDPRFILNLGLVYMVLTSLALGLITHWTVPTGHADPFRPMLSWVGVVVVMSAAIVPNVPLKILVAGLAAASMNPGGMLVARARGVGDFGVADVLTMHYPDYLLVGVSVVISVVMTRLGRQVASAREMGSYRLVSLLGRGGMGEVWRARHRMLARDAAIKLIKPDMLSAQSGRNAPMLLRRFEQEAKSTAALRSPHTVGLYDFGVTADGVFYYVMELLDGIDLETVVNRFGPLPPGRVVNILRQVCRSLGEAHRQRMVHRDIKATNILLCRLGNEVDFVKVLDFGLVKVQEPEDTKLTLVGTITGTPAFMAPELALGQPDIDGRADLYALGCVAYWLITGKPVFDEAGGSAMLLAHLNKLPVLPSERTVNRVPQSLERIIMMCLAKDRADRPADAKALQHMLESAVDIDVWSAKDAEDWWRTNVPENAEDANTGTIRTGRDSYTTV